MVKFLAHFKQIMTFGLSVVLINSCSKITKSQTSPTNTSNQTKTYISSSVSTSAASLSSRSNTSSSLSSSKSSSINSSSLSDSDFYFSGDFNDVTVNNNLNSPDRLVGWSNLKALLDNLHLNNVVSDYRLYDYAYQSIKVIQNQKCLFAKIIEDDPTKSGTSRAQLSIRFKDSTDLGVYHTRQRMYLNPEIEHLENYPDDITWFTLFEIWNERNPNWDGSESGSARWGLSINKEKGVGSKLFWRFKGETMQPESDGKNYLIPKSYNKNVSIPFGKWFTLDFYMKRGEQNNGEIKISIKVDGEPEQTVFHLFGSTVYPNHPELKLNSWQPFKLYLDNKHLLWMKEQNKNIDACYSSFIWLKN